ncbi:NOL1 NOP2 sun family protein [Lactobacillus pasteurii DSM 23907 = CRBIP 24.76]|uniref:NOL1/NOP2/sun family protein n=1 Tax=Lactobacillus pasteurii DSM 23907 = CRBIP 24.76 TaxID=1423790 RepID=I7J0A2_9LACO|nr:RsmB/NOP family class I SAM-dependent RNA methyltransferase [Lactobacillus pasteurii]KRK08550.1 NOL1 NOP2 sun family protein [Lactobacillus pasteurii DSM 23907 = CRBIP 24.76]TDG75729.1 hypothetical protein C5L33_000614 [Lactobacillus pasteurii]CCI85587.1 NOL1/NOP2/sun family protein [Lactobacillus pasteurii DSM 23907 = CRBIP 24.76]
MELPAGFKEKYVALLGESESDKLFEALQADERKAYRLNTLKDSDKVTYSKNMPVPEIKQAYYGEINGTDPEWVSGLVYSQDPSAMFPAHVAQVRLGEKVLDLCAAPGGKSTGLGEALEGKGILVSNEISATRVKALRENIERWGIANALITNNDSATLAKKFPNYFDTILVDAPCSGEGMFRKSQEAIDYWNQDYVITCQNRQKEILVEADKMLKPGGKLVYSTCTFSPEEDEEIVAWLVNDLNYKIEPIEFISSDKISHGHPEWADENLPELAETLRFWPQDNLGEGQFVAVLTKNGEFVEVSEKKKKKNLANKNKLSAQELSYVADVLEKFNLPATLQDWKAKLCLSNGHVFLPVIAPNDLKGIKVINNGLELGLLKKNRFEPGHQLAMVLGDVKQEQVVDLANKEEFDKYLHGETVNVTSKVKGFSLVSYQGMIFSFGKVTGNGVLKNFYPKGLRK